MIYIVISFLAFLITVVSTPFLIQFLVKKDIVDKPNGEERRMHTEPVPRMGGIIIFAVILIITFIFYQDIYSKLFFIVGAITAFGLGFVDDIKGVKWQLKFFFQSIAAILLILSFNTDDLTVIKFMGLTLLPGLNYAILFILIVGLLNSFNMMDGLDGLVTGYSLIVAALVLLLSIGAQLTFLGYLSSAIIGTTFGFLKFNANPARIFLGDSGSLTLGYFISGIVIAISGEALVNTSSYPWVFSNSIDLTFIIITLAVPIADTIRVLLVRVNKKRHPFLADTNHLHHILYSQNIQHKTAVVLIHLLSIIFVLLAIYYAKFSKTYAFIIFTVLLIALFSIKKILQFVINREHLLELGRLYKKIPDLLPKIYKTFLLPLVSFVLIFLFIFLILNEVNKGQNYYFYFLLFIVTSLIYSSTTFRKNSYYTELMVLVNIIFFFIVTGFNGFFYELYPVPIFEQININQIFIIVLSGMIIFFVLFKERIANISKQFLTGTDLTIAILIIFIFLAVQFLNLPAPYKISDTLLRSFLVFLFYKIIIATVPRIHFSLYFASFIVTVIVVLKSLF